MPAPRVRRGFVRLWVLISALWVIAVFGVFTLNETTRPKWSRDEMLLPPTFVDMQTGKIVPPKLKPNELEYLRLAVPPWQYYQLVEVNGDTGWLTLDQYEALKQTMLGWKSYKKRLPDWSPVAARAPTEQAADQLLVRYWEENGGWWGHRWTYGLLALLVPPLLLYGLGWAVGWVAAGFRRA